MTSADQACFDALVERHGAQVLRVCRAILRDEHLGRDASQETFVKLWGRVAGGALPDQVQAWLRRVAVSTSLDFVRKRRLRTPDEQASHAEPVADTAEVQPLARASLAELEHSLALALDELPEGQRTVFQLRHEGGLALSEVAEVLGVALPTVKTQFARACVRLQTKLARYHSQARDASQ